MFEAFEMIMNRLLPTEDAYMHMNGDTYVVTVNDFEGFDENWSEMDREFVDPEMVEALFEVLDSAERVNGLYSLDGKKVELHFSSEDI